MKEVVNFEDFSKIELRVGTILEASPVEDSNKLVKLIIDIGTEKRQVIAGIKKSYQPESLIGGQVVIVANLAPKSLAGLESHGMLLAAHDADGLPIVLRPDRQVPDGSEVS